MIPFKTCGAAASWLAKNASKDCSILIGYPSDWEGPSIRYTITVVKINRSENADKKVFFTYNGTHIKFGHRPYKNGTIQKRKAKVENSIPLTNRPTEISKYKIDVSEEIAAQKRQQEKLRQNFLKGTPLTEQDIEEIIKQSQVERERQEKYRLQAVQRKFAPKVKFKFDDDIKKLDKERKDEYNSFWEK